ncbi:MAG: hypothetical protein IPK10_09545 [Bacteroidetes bacterium]|nr:hypothetical protein [Bacteroidota bacterium]
MSKLLSIITLLLISSTFSRAQNDLDALRYSMLNYGSTARSLGMGNSFGALGADFSSLSGNPAGIAVYRRSEFTFSPMFSNRTTNANYLGQDISDNSFKFSFGNLGMVWASNRDQSSSNWKGVAFGIGYNRTNDFNGRYTASAGNPMHSLLDNYLEALNGVDPNDIPSYYPFDVDLAWQTYLIDEKIDSVNGNSYFSVLDNAGALQTKTVETKGGQGEWDFTFGGNYDERLYLGFTLGIASLRYEEESTWEEKDHKDTILGFSSFQYNQDLKTSGSGINLKFGLIYRPVDAIRIGFAIHSPTWYTLVDKYSASIKTDLQDGNIRSYAGPEFIPFDYKITTPFRVMTNFALILGKSAALNVDYEYLNYSEARVKPVDRSFSADFNPVNNAIRKKYAGSHNLRAGVEFRVEQFRFRTGGFYSTSPFKSELQESSDNDLSRVGLTGGFGMREKKWYFDIGYSWSQQGSFMQPYTLNNQTTEGITLKETTHRVLTTFGFIF